MSIADFPTAVGVYVFAVNQKGLDVLLVLETAGGLLVYIAIELKWSDPHSDPATTDTTNKRDNWDKLIATARAARRFPARACFYHVTAIYRDCDVKHRSDAVLTRERMRRLHSRTLSAVLPMLCDPDMLQSVAHHWPHQQRKPPTK